MADRSHLSIGDVLSLLQEDFPEVTISKIRFLESQGLLDPERTPSGYRKFYENDIERLRWILRHQRDHFLPLKVMKERLQKADEAGLPVPPDEPPAPPKRKSPSLFEDASLLEVPTAEEAPAKGRSSRRSSASRSTAERVAPRAKPPLPPLRPPTDAPNPLDGGATSGTFTLTELAAASGLTEAALGELARFGLLHGREVGGDTFFDGDALVVASTAASFDRFGVEARHLRMYKVAAEREAGFIEQVVMPLLKQRNPSARQQAADNLGELARLGEQLRSALLREALRDHTDPR